MITSKREGFDCVIRPAPSGAGRTTPSQPGHYPLIWLCETMGGMLLMCQNTTMRVYGARIKIYCVLCSKHIAIRVVLSKLPAGSRQAAWWRPYLGDWSIRWFHGPDYFTVPTPHALIYIDRFTVPTPSRVLNHQHKYGSSQPSSDAKPLKRCLCKCLCRLNTFHSMTPLNE